MAWWQTLKLALARILDAPVERAEAQIDIPASLGRWARTAWEPILGNDANDAHNSHLGGLPWLGQESPWPACAVCKRPMRLMVQIHLDNLPRGAPLRTVGGLLQVFDCTDTHGALARRIEIGEAGLPPPNDDAPAIGARAITGWRPFDDLPGEADADTAQAKMSAADAARTAELGLPSPADKLGGWPSWSLDPQTRSCPLCSRLRVPVIQMSSQQPSWLLISCPDHPDELQLVTSPAAPTQGEPGT